MVQSRHRSLVWLNYQFTVVHITNANGTSSSYIREILTEPTFVPLLVVKTKYWIFQMNECTHVSQTETTHTDGPTQIITDTIYKIMETSHSLFRFFQTL